MEKSTAETAPVGDSPQIESGSATVIEHPSSKVVATPRQPSCVPPDKSPLVTEIFRSIQRARKRPLFVLVSHFIDDDVCADVYSWKKALRVAGRSDSLDILIHSPGGNLTSCYTVARLFARCANSWEALVPRYAASGATLISLGSSNIVLAETAQLGPLDPQVTSKHEKKFFMLERQSPLEGFQALRYMREVALTTLDSVMAYLLSEQGVAPRPALETATKMSVELSRPILDKIDPYDLGAFSLDSDLATNYCRRIATPADPSKRTQRNARFTDLVENYPAHEFVIDIDEAKSLGFAVCPPDDSIDELFESLRPHIDEIHKYVGLIADDDGVQS